MRPLELSVQLLGALLRSIPAFPEVSKLLSLTLGFSLEDKESILH